jgi:hypothetical protein
MMNGCFEIDGEAQINATPMKLYFLLMHASVMSPQTAGSCVVDATLFAAHLDGESSARV